MAAPSQFRLVLKTDPSLRQAPPFDTVFDRHRCVGVRTDGNYEKYRTVQIVVFLMNER